MMKSPDLKNLSPFGLCALKLDNDFTELDQLKGQIEKLSLDSDYGLDRAKQLLIKFSECSGRITDGLQMFAKELAEARGRAEASAAAVSERATLIQERQNVCHGLHERFQNLASMVKKLSTNMEGLKRPKAGELSPEEKTFLATHLPLIDSQLGVLADESGKLRDDARQAKMKSLEKKAESLGQTLFSARRKLTSFHQQSL